MSRHNHSHAHTEPSIPSRQSEFSPRSIPAAEPTHEEIAKRAYEIYEKTGHTQGQCKQNWNAAKQSLHDQCHCTGQASHDGRQAVQPTASTKPALGHKPLTKQITLISQPPA